MSCASRKLTGASRTRTSPRSSTARPPAPQATTGPKSGSPTTPAIISTPADAIRWARNPSGSYPAARTAQAKPHGADVRFVDQPRRDDLHGHFATELHRAACDGGRAGGGPTLDD